ncbi:C1 family peptidase [Leptospira sp. 96542]|nr:C1 family peptidase [Leptospira sp. 96542]
MKFKIFRFLLTINLLFVTSIHSEEFDPSSVRSPDCKPGTFSCGYIPAPKEIQDSIPLKRDFNSFEDLPKSVDISSKMPPVGNQGRQNSCVAWASGYAIKSYLAKNNGNKGNYDPPFNGGAGENVFSPAFIYNQQNGGKDNGLYYYKTMEFLQKSGVVPWKSMPYTDKDYKKQPTAALKKEGEKYKIKSFSRLNFKKPDEIKRVLAGGNVVLIGVIIDDGFYKLKGSEVYDANAGQSYGGHAMTIVGYDDNKKAKSGRKGAFKMLNSWGTSWGDKGYGWISYTMLAKAGQESYALIDEVKTNPVPMVTNIPVLNPISPPEDILASKGEFPNKIILTWSANPNALAYFIQKKEMDGSFEDVGYATSATFTDLDVSPNSSYSYLIYSMTAEETSVPSKQVEGFTSAEPNSNSKLEKVVGVRGSAYTENNINKFEIFWSEVDGANGYLVSKLAADHSWKNLAKVKDPFYRDSSPSPGSNVYRVAAAINTKQSGDWSDSFEVIFGSSDSSPNQVSGMTASDSEFSDRIVLSWNQAPGASVYYLFRFDENANPSGQFETSDSGFVDSDPMIQTGKGFLYTVIAANELGYSEPSDVVEGKVDPGLQKRGGLVLAPPKNLNFELGKKDKTVNLKWSPVKDSFEYYIYRKSLTAKDKKSKNEFHFVNSVPGNKTTYSEKFPGNTGELFLYAVRSKSELGSESKNSNLVSVFLNESKPTVKKRTMSLEEIPKTFLGTWSGMYWNPKSGPQNLSIVSKGNHQDFQIELSINGKKFKEFKGSWTPGSSILRTNGFQFELSKDMEDASLVRFEGIPELKDANEIGFSRDGD